MRSLSHCRTFLTAISFLMVPLSLKAEEKLRLAFKVVSDAESGLKAIVAKWKEDELKRQGGKFGSHGWWPWGLAAFDYDNDGCLDLIAQQHGAPCSIILRGLHNEKGTVSFVNVTDKLEVGQAVLPGCFKPHIWDVDGDGWLDIVGTDARPNTCFFNKEGNRFEPMKFGFGQLASLREVGDLNGDGYPDIYTVREGFKYLYEPRARTFKKSPYLPPHHEKPPECLTEFLREAKEKNRFLDVRFIEGNDLNGDGRPDLVCAGYASYGGIAFGRFLLADGKWTDQTAALGLPLEGTPTRVVDLNDDGAVDLLIAAGPKGGLYLNDGKGKFTHQPGDLSKFLAARGAYLQKVYVHDLNNDGLPDLVISNARGGQEEVYENVGGGQFRRVFQARGWDADPIALGDFNDDGLLNVAIGGPGDTITLYLNKTTNPGKSCQLFPRMEKPNPFAIGTRVEVFREGEMKKPGKRPFWSETVHADGTPIHVGLGTATKVDLRVSFAGKTPITVEHPSVELKRKVKITPDGKIESHE